jgi:EAL domain-containing protein (putative c-di-GMP-specific phosphodiesterase class I)
MGQVLQRAVAQRLADNVRGGDTVAPVGDGEFVVLWTGVGNDEEAQALARRCTDLFATPFAPSGLAAPVTLSAGLGLAMSKPSDSADSVLRRARQALLAAISSGRRAADDRSPDGFDAADSSLQAALSRGDFVLHYQPVVDVERGVVTAVEALVRWQRPDGLLMPDTFIPGAEASGLIVPLGAWVIEEACRQGAEWLERGLDLDMAVNLSARQVCHPDVVATITGALERSGLPRHRLLVEITESTMMDDADIALTTLTRIAGMGPRIAIDDFGTGYSSLMYLRRYPVHALKIDRSFVAGLGRHRSDDAIVSSVIGLARAVGADCIAEGVETELQLKTLRAMGCKRAQGYLFGRPVPAAGLPGSVSNCETLLGLSSRAVTRANGEPLALPYVRARIEELHGAGASPLTIAAVLNREGADHPRNIRWHGSAVIRQLAARTAAGHEVETEVLESAG